MTLRARLWAGAMLMLAMTAPARAEVPTAETVVATVNGTDITVGQMIALRETLPDQYQALADDVLFKGILEQLIQQVALSQAVKEPLSTRDALNVENQRLTYLSNVTLNGVVAAAVTHAAVQAAYDARYANVDPGLEYHAAHVLVETEEEAKAIKAEVDGGADFDKIAEEKSTGPSGPNGGDLGWFGKGMMVEPFEKAVMAMEPGTISAPVQTQFGWHVIKLIETRAATSPSLDEVRGELEAEIQQKAIETAVVDAVAKSDVARNDEGIDPAILRNGTLIDN